MNSTLTRSEPDQEVHTLSWT